MEKTIFEKILLGEIPSEKVFENENVLAFKDVSPQAPVHVLVIPKKRAANINDLEDFSDAEAGLFLKGISEVTRALELTEKGYRVVLNTGKFGQQTVEYLHAHILGGRQMNWPPG